MKASALIAYVAVVFSCECNLPAPTRLCLDPSFTAEEHEMMQAAVDRWHDFSGGRINLEVTCEQHALVNVHKVPSTFPLIQEADAQHHLEAVGLTTREEIYIVEDRLDPSTERQVMQHELGHLIGLRWPGCTANASECVHTAQDYGPAIMTPYLSGANEFTEQDYVFCHDSGVCP